MMVTAVLPWLDVPANSWTLPSADELLLTVIGPGFGESVVVHVGDNVWGIVDSCRRNKVVLPLDYLRRLGVDLANVKFVVATHFDKDHVEGLAEVVQECRQAKLFIPGAGDVRQFLQLLGSQAKALDRVAQAGPMRAALVDLRDAIDIANRRSDLPGGVGWASVNAPRQIHRSDQNATVESIVEAWSPGDAVRNECDVSIADALATLLEGERVAPGRTRQNPLSMVLWVRVGDRRCLLGADLEKSKAPGRGWTGVVELAQQSSANGNGGEYLKVPHHGSAGADDDLMWTHLLSRPRSVVAPWELAGKWLPQPHHITRLRSRSSEVWVTAPHRVPGQSPPPATSQAVGHVTFRSPANGTANWSTTASDVAAHYTGNTP